MLISQSQILKSDTESRYLSFARQLCVKDGSGHKYSCKKVSDEADHQGYRKALHGAGPEDEQKRTRYHGGNVRVDNGQESLGKARVHGGYHGLAGAQLLPNALKDQNVAVH